MKITLALAAAAALAIPGVAAAQDAHAGHDMTADATAVSDAELTEFVSIALQGKAMENDASMTDQQKQMKMVELIGQSEMGLERFSQIAERIGEDEALMQRLQTELASQMMAG